MNGSSGNPTSIQGSQVGVVLTDQDPVQEVQKGGQVLHSETVWGENYGLLNAIMEGTKEVDFMKWAENDMKLKGLKVDEMKLKATIELNREAKEEKAAREKRRLDAEAEREAKKIEDARLKGVQEEQAERLLDIETEIRAREAGFDWSNQIHNSNLKTMRERLAVGDILDTGDPLKPFFHVNPETGAEYNYLEDREIIEALDRLRRLKYGVSDLQDTRGIGGLIND